eukprot:m.1035125 g.1035125  ORF g.1035125 m.1035125 type:complete len:583 (-) comp24136_c1_seq27:1977-3725(-)
MIRFNSKTLARLVLVLVSVATYGAAAEQTNDERDVFSSTSATVDLYAIRNNLSGVLHEYIAAERDRLLKLEHLTTQLRKAPMVTEENFTAAHGYEIISDFERIMNNLILLTTPRDENVTEWYQHSKHAIPASDDANGARNGIQAFDQQDWTTAQQWLSAAFEKRAEFEAEPRGLLPVEISINESIDTLLDYYSYVAYKTDDLELAIALSSELFERHPDEFRFEDNLASYAAALEEKQGSASMYTESANHTKGIQSNVCDEYNVFHTSNGTIVRYANGSTSNLSSCPSHTGASTSTPAGSLQNSTEAKTSDNQAPVSAPTPNFEKDNLLRHDEDEMHEYRALCQRHGVPALREALQGNTSAPAYRGECKLTTRGGRPELMLRPAKVETITDVHGAVRLRVFRDFLVDSEREHIVTAARERLQRSVAFNSTGYAPAEFRISKVAWFKNDVDEVFDAVNRRIEHWTGLSMATAEELQVCNYGVSGHYEPHYDYGRVDHTDARGMRLATFMMYLSSVAEGGSTVFPRLGLGVTPHQNDAVSWHNLRPEQPGWGNELTLHAGCPVVQGSKWVANKWIHEGGNSVCTI